MSFSTTLGVVFAIFITYLCNGKFFEMKHISIIMPVGNSIIDTIIAPYNLLLMANTYFRRIHQNEEAPFNVDLVGISEEPVLYQGLFSVTPTTTINRVDRTDLIIVTAISGNLEKEIDWLQQRIGVLEDKSSRNQLLLLSDTKMLSRLMEEHNSKRGRSRLKTIWDKLFS